MVSSWKRKNTDREFAEKLESEASRGGVEWTNTVGRNNQLRQPAALEGLVVGVGSTLCQQE